MEKTYFQPKIPDLKEIKKLPALDVGLELGIIHQNVDKPDSDRYAFVGETSRTGLQFFEHDGKFHNHKTGEGGSCVDLVMQYLAGVDNDFRPNQEIHFREALHKIADQYGLWINFDKYRDKSRALAINPTDVFDSIDHLDKLEGGIISVLGSVGEIPGAYLLDDQIREAQKLFDALGLDIRKVTFCSYPAGGATLGFVPGAPYFDPESDRAKISKGEYQIASRQGWTKNAILRNFDQDRTRRVAGRIIAVDIDGDEGGLPRVTDIRRLAKDLENLNLPPCAVVLSSFDENDPSRAKAHFYFKEKVELGEAIQSDEIEKLFLQNHRTIEGAIDSIVNSWTDTPDEFKGHLKRDQSVSQISRIFRVPGFNKLGSDFAGVVFMTFQSGLDGVDLETYRESRNFSFSVSDSLLFSFGDRCWKLTTKFDEDGNPEEPIKIKLADSVWPTALVYDAETGEHGIQVRFKDVGQNVRYSTVSTSATVDSYLATKEAGRLAALGAAITPGRGKDLIEALGYWKNIYLAEAKKINNFSSPGWKTTQDDNATIIYVPHCMLGKGAPTGSWRRFREVEYYDDDKELEFVEKWKSEISTLARTPYLQSVMALSLASGMIGMLKEVGIDFWNPFLLHLHGSSSCGKTLTSKLALTIWGRPGQWIRTWNSTANALEDIMQDHSGALIVLDEVKEAKPYHVRDIVHSLEQGKGRERLKRSGEARQRRRVWSTLGLSTGENSLSEYVGHQWQGGNSVRGIDLPVEVGELTVDKAHADDIKEFIASSNIFGFGAVGKYLVKNLVQLANDYKDNPAYLDTMATTIRRKARAYDFTDGETGRIYDNFLLLDFAIQIAKELDLWPDNFIDSVSEFLIEKSIEHRGELTSPGARAASALIELATKNRSRIPKFPDLDNPIHRGEVIGFLNYMSDWPYNDGRSIILSETLLRGTDVLRNAGISARQFRNWCRDNGRFFIEDRWRSIEVNGMKGRWWLFILDPDDNDSGEPISMVQL